MIWALILLSAMTPKSSAFQTGTGDFVRKTAEAQIHNLLDPMLEKYCHIDSTGLSACKVMSVDVNIDLESPDEVAPGFEDVDPKSALRLSPSSAHIKVLMDEKVPRQKLLTLMQQYLDTLDYKVDIEVKVASFPQPPGSAGKVGVLRDRITRQFKQTMDDLFRQFCPNQCLLADYDLQTSQINPDEAQYGSSGDVFEEGDTAVRVSALSATVLLDNSLSPQDQTNIMEVAKLRTNSLKNVNLSGKAITFPHPKFDLNGNYIGGRYYNPDGSAVATNRESKQSQDSTSNATNSESNSAESKSEFKSDSRSASNSTNNNNETTARQERIERFEKIERVENGDAVQKELAKFKVFGIIFACSVLSLLIFLALATYNPRWKNPISSVNRIIHGMGSDAGSDGTTPSRSSEATTASADRGTLVAKRYEIERLTEELMAVFAQQPRVAKVVFSRVLTEEGVEVTAGYINIFGESVVMDMLRDPSLQSDLGELMEYYAKNPFELTDDDKLELLRGLHNRTIAGKLVVMGNRSSNLFDFLAEMDGLQILNLIRNESLTVKSIVLTQCDPQKRTIIYQQLDEDIRMKLLTELSRIDYLPRDYIFNVANSLKRKRREDPKLNTEALPGSEVLVNLLERTGPEMQKAVVKNLEHSHPENARTVKSKLVSIDTLRFLRDGQLLEVVLSLKHDELLQFLKGAPTEIRNAIYSKSPKELIAELDDELAGISLLGRETYQQMERKVINRMKLMANEGLINLVEVNDRMFNEQHRGAGFVDAGPPPNLAPDKTSPNLKKVAGW